MREIRFFTCLVVILTAACTSPQQRSIVPAFYHWQTMLELSPTERNYLDSLGCNKLYVKVLDIGRDPVTKEILPYSRLEITDTTGLSGLEIVPVVFITNEVFQNISAEKIEWLAGKVAATVINPTPDPSPNGRGDVERSVEGAAGGALYSSSPFTLGMGWSELQFDCDWTSSTRDAFFLFLKQIKKHLPENTRLSATIRLHQYKFPGKTGVPPVERGMLMFYNTGNIEDMEAENSIFSPADAEKYIKGAPESYPLPLDLALPLFSWALVYRDGELWKIIPEMPESEWSDTTRFLKFRIPHSIFRIQKGTFISGHYLRPGDLLRVEAIPPDLLREAARLAAQTDMADDAAVAFFHLDTAIVHRYPVQLLDSVCRMINFPEKKN